MIRGREGDFTRGTDTRRFAASDYREIAARLESARTLSAVPPLVVPEPRTLALSLPEGFWAELSGASSPYSWAEKQGDTGGTWAAGVRSGATNAYEVNGVGGLGGKTVWLGPGWPGDYRFQWVANGAGGGPGDGVGLPGCACPIVPVHLYLVVDGPCGEGTFPPATFTYAETPPELTGLDLGSHCHLSDETYFDIYSGAPYRLHIGCNTVFLRLSRVYLPTGGGGATHDATIYTWSIGQPGNTCVPFAMTVGFIYPGGNPLCSVDLLA